MKTLKENLKKWAIEWPETHWLLVLAILTIPLAGWLIGALTGYQPKEGFTWILGLSNGIAITVIRFALATVLWRFSLKFWPEKASSDLRFIGSGALFLALFTLVIFSSNQQ